MPDSISREWLLDLYDESKLTKEEKTYGVPFNIIRQNIIDAPAVDAVLVVRCGKCRYLRPSVDVQTGETIGHWCEHMDLPDIDVDDFCSYGERKDGES